VRRHDQDAKPEPPALLGYALRVVHVQVDPVCPWVFRRRVLVPEVRPPEEPVVPMLIDHAAELHAEGPEPAVQVAGRAKRRGVDPNVAPPGDQLMHQIARTPAHRLVVDPPAPSRDELFARGGRPAHQCVVHVERDSHAPGTNRRPSSFTPCRPGRVATEQTADSLYCGRLVLLLTLFAALTIVVAAVLWLVSVLGQGWLYNDLARHLPLRALAGGAVMSLFLTAWCAIYRADPGRFDTLVSFKTER